MSLIEKVAKAIKNKRDDLIANALWQVYPQLAQAAISAMSSIKWQKIETLPDSYINKQNNSNEFSTWTTEALIEYEQELYEDEVKGEDTWELRDAILWELNRRKAL